MFVPWKCHGSPPRHPPRRPPKPPFHSTLNCQARWSLSESLMPGPLQHLRPPTKNHNWACWGLSCPPPCGPKKRSLGQTIGNSQKGGGAKLIVRFWGGETYYRAPKTSFGGLRKWDLSGLCPFLLRRMAGREQRGGKSYHRWVRPKPFLGRGFMVCFPLA